MFSELILNQNRTDGLACIVEKVLTLKEVKWRVNKGVVCGTMHKLYPKIQNILWLLWL